MRTRENLLTLILIIVIGFLCWYIWRINKNMEQIMFDAKHNYRTDTIVSQIPYQDLRRDTYDIKVNPRVIVNYPPIDLSHLKITLDSNSIHIINPLTKDTAKIANTFLKQYPKNPKILYGNFTKDSLTLELLNTQGEIYSTKYPVDYLEFKYQFINGELRADKIKGKLFKQTRGYLLVNGGYDIFSNKPLAEINYMLNYRKFWGSANLGLLVSEKPQPYFQLKLGYQIK